MMQINKNDIVALKSFALTMSWAFPVVFSLLLPWLFSFHWQLWPLAISTVLMTLYFVKPSLIYYPFRVWMTIGGVLGWINTRIILGASFYILIAPIGLVLRVVGKLQYQVKKNKNQTSSYKKPDSGTDKKNLEYPF